MNPETLRVIAAREEAVAASKATLMGEIRTTVTFLNASEEVSGDTKTSALLALYERVTEHVNLVESLIAQDDLSGASDNERWRVFRAETALNLLDMYPSLHAFFRQWASNVGMHMQAFSPSRTAMASSQRLVAEVYPDEASELEQSYATAGLPVHGFRQPIPRVRRDQETGATVEFADGGGLRTVSGVSSKDAVLVATGVAHSGMKGFSAPAQATGAEDVLNAGTHRSATDNWLRRQQKALADSPVAVLVAVAGTLLSAAIMAWATSSGP